MEIIYHKHNSVIIYLITALNLPEIEMKKIVVSNINACNSSIFSNTYTHTQMNIHTYTSILIYFLSNLFFFSDVNRDAVFVDVSNVDDNEDDVSSTAATFDASFWTNRHIDHNYGNYINT